MMLVSIGCAASVILFVLSIHFHIIDAKQEILDAIKKDKE